MNELKNSSTGLKKEEFPKCPFCGSNFVYADLYYDGPTYKCITEGCAIYEVVIPTSVAWNRPIEDALQARIPQWISVKDRLPENRGYYLWYGEDLGIDVEYYLSGTDAGYLYTHWMPLPEPPKENE